MQTDQSGHAQSVKHFIKVNKLTTTLVACKKIISDYVCFSQVKMFGIHVNIYAWNSVIFKHTLCWIKFNIF